MTRFLLVLILFFGYSCSEKENNLQAVYFAGEIVNPTSDHVVLFKNDIVVDSAILDTNNRFSFSLDTVDKGLYHFDHSPELQYVFLESGDSILIRLNTVDFDESLVFSGEGSEINNFLIEMFLAFEKERPLVYKYYGLSPELFSVKVDSLRNEKLEMLEELEAEGSLSEAALKIGRASVDYNTLIYKEKYPFYHKKRTGEESIHLSSDFYNYRKKIDLNDVDLVYFKPYYDYLLEHFDNITYMDCKKECDLELNNKKMLLHFNKHKLHLVDSLVKKEPLRNILFRNIAMKYLLNEHRINDESEKFIKKFNMLSSNEKHITEIHSLYEGIKRLQSNSELPNMMVQDTAGNTVSLREIAKNEKTVFYFWTASQKMHFKKVNERIAHLKKKQDGHTFVGICLQTSKDQWKKMVMAESLEASRQYRSDDFYEIQRALVINNLNKCVIAKDSIIIDGFANVYSSF